MTDKDKHTFKVLLEAEGCITEVHHVCTAKSVSKFIKDNEQNIKEITITNIR
jgi:hypothetical protein